MIETRTFARFQLILILAAGAALSAAAQSDVEDLKLTIGKSVIVDYPSDISRISTSNPEVVDAVAVTTREFLLHAKGNGTGTVIVWAKAGQRTMYNVTVDQNLDPVRKLLKDTFPNEEIHIQSARDSISLTGFVSGQPVADRVMALVAPSAKTVVNNLQVQAAPSEKQILLRVRFAQMDRNTASAVGVNLLSTGALNTIGRTTTGQFSAPSINSINPGGAAGGGAAQQNSFTLSDALNVFAFRPDLNLGAVIRALQSQGILQILAEPNLITTNGKEATFLVGGEFPVPVLQGGANSGAISVMFREFGIRLNFTPVITANRTIKLYVKPEVSTIDIANGVTVSGFTIPALATRRIETNIELGEGQSFVIAGLIDDRVQDSMSRIPGLSHIPILGALFKTKEDKKSKTELMVMVTPEIVEPLQPTDVKPMPIMPKEFLKPLDPADVKGDGAAVQKSKVKVEPGKQS